MAGNDEFKPIYTTFESVKARLAGKVSFQSGASIVNQRQLSDALLGQMIVDAETAVEQDLRGRYKIPFQSIRSKTWQGLPDHSRRAIRTIIDMKACILILSDSFGSGTHISADPYVQKLSDNYDAMLRRLLGQDMAAQETGEHRFKRTPPLEDMALSAANVADDGLFGMPIDAGSQDPYSGADFAASRVNDPSLGVFYFGGRRGPR